MIHFDGELEYVQFSVYAKLGRYILFTTESNFYIWLIQEATPREKTTQGCNDLCITIAHYSESKGKYLRRTGDKGSHERTWEHLTASENPL